MLNPTPAARLVDARGRLYFLRGSGITLEQFLSLLRDPGTRLDCVRRLLRDAKPDDVFSFLSLEEVAEIWPAVEKLLEPAHWDFWSWLLEEWEEEALDGEPELASTPVAGEGNADSSPHGLLVGSFCALAAGFDIQRLEEIRILLENGGQLKRALGDIPSRETGFSPLLLAWRLHKLDLRGIGLELDLNANFVERLDRFNRRLVQRILRSCRPVACVS